MNEVFDGLTVANTDPFDEMWEAQRGTEIEEDYEEEDYEE